MLKLQTAVASYNKGTTVRRYDGTNTGNEYAGIGARTVPNDLVSGQMAEHGSVPQALSVVPLEGYDGVRRYDALPCRRTPSYPVVGMQGYDACPFTVVTSGWISSIRQNNVLHKMAFSGIEFGQNPSVVPSYRRTLCLINYDAAV